METTIFRILPVILMQVLLLTCGCGNQTEKTAGTVSRIEDLNSPEYRIGCMTGIVATKEAKKKLPNAKFPEYAMPIDAFTALCAGKTDAMVLDRPTLEFMALAHRELIVAKENIAIGHISVGAAKRSTALMRKVNVFIRKYRSDGTYRKMYDRWFHRVHSVMPEIPVPEKPSGVLKVGITANNEPMCFIQNGKMAGFDSEFSLRLALFLNREIRFIDLPYDALPAALDSGKIDLAVAQMDALPEREESVLFSENYIDSPITIILHRKKCSEKILNGILTDGHEEKTAGTNGVLSRFTGQLKSACVSFVSSFEKTFIRESRWKLILQGLCTTIVITVFSVIFGTLFAFPVCMICRSGKKFLSWIGERYVSLIMGTPILVILMILYYVVFAKVDINGIIVAVIAFSMDFSAYTSVTLRSGIESVPKGQTEAALALGHTPAMAFLRFVLPQAAEHIMPVYRGEIISTLKATSIVGYIAIMDLTKAGDIIRSRTYEAFFPLIAIAVIYFLTAKCLTQILIAAEKSMSPEQRRSRMQKRSAK